MTLAELAKIVDADVVGDPTVPISGVATLDEARPEHVSFLANPKYHDRLETTQAGAVLVAPGTTSDRLNLLVTKDPYLAFCKAVVALVGYRKHPFTGVHPLAYVDPTAQIGEGTTIYPHCFIGPRVKIGKGCTLYPSVSVYDDCVIGDRVTIHANSVIGQDGFGYATSNGVHHKIPQAGNVVIEDDVEMGSCCTIQRATLGSTVIGRGTKIGDMLDVGHGTKIGEFGLIVGVGGIAGSVTIGHHLTLGGGSAIVGHLKIGDNVTVAAHSLVIHSLDGQTTVSGLPALPISQTRRNWALTARLPELLQRIKELEQQVEELAAEPEDPSS